MTNTESHALDFPFTVGPVYYADGERKGQLVEGSTLITTPDWTAQLSARSPRYLTRRSLFSNTRVYGALDAFIPGYSGLEHAQYQLIPDKKIKDPTYAAWQRAQVKVAKREMLLALPAVARMLRSVGREVEMTKLEARWSIHAGCSMCPCSKGFVLGERVLVDGAGVDMWFESVFVDA